MKNKKPLAEDPEAKELRKNTRDLYNGLELIPGQRLSEDQKKIIIEAIRGKERKG